MEVGLVALGWTIAICVIVGLLLGYVIGHVQHRGKGKAADEAVKTHEDYREEVHEHFQQTSQIMSRMVDDYREMYQHLSAGAGKLANIHPERVVTPPPAPEAITAQAGDAAASAPDEAKAGAAAAATTTPADDSGKSEDKPEAATKPGGEQAQASATTEDKPPEDAAKPRVDEAEKARARRLSGNAV